MNKRNLLSASLLTAIAAVLIFSCNNGTPPPPPDADMPKPDSNWICPVPNSVKFGVSTNGCAGKGICKVNTSAIITSVNATAKTENNSFSNGIPIKFGFGKINSNIIYIGFSINQDTAKSQPDQAPYWRAGAAPYSFDMPFSVSKDNPAFSADNGWTLPAGTIIPADSPFHTWGFDAKNGFITLEIHSVLSKPVTLNVIFGGIDPTTNNYDPTAKGIYQVSADSIPPSGNIPASVKTTFSLLSADATRLLMSFDQNALITTESQQAPNFDPTKNTTYPFATAYNFSDPVFASVYLPLYAAAMTNSASTFQLSGTNIVDTINYGLNPISSTSPICAAATGLEANDIESASIKVDWKYATPCKEFKILISITEKGGYTTAGTVAYNGPNSYAYNIAGLTAATTYYIKIQTVCTDGSTIDTTPIAVKTNP